MERIPKNSNINNNSSLLKGLIGKQKQLESPQKQKNRKNYSCSPKFRSDFEGTLIIQNVKQSNTSNTKYNKKQSLQNPITQTSDFNIQKRNSQKAQTLLPSNSQKNIQINQIQNTNLDIIKEKKPKNNKNTSNSNNQLSQNNNDTNNNQNNENQNVNNTKPTKKKDKKQQKLKLTQLKDLKPINLEQEKAIFFQKQHQYNPIFLYSVQDIQFSIQSPHTKHMSLAVKIMDAVLENYKSEEQWNIQEGGSILNQEQTQDYFQKYIDDLQIQEYISFEFSENTISPTSCIHNNVEGVSKVVIGLPIQYRTNRIMGVLNHEIGTHFIRKYNDKQQKWNKYRKKYDLQNHSKIEEGLASINQLFETALDSNKKPFLYKAALHYYASVQASYMSFQDLFRDLERYIKNPEDRWKECVRVKRGITDTQQKNGQYKDQIYLRGAVKILNFRNQLNFINLHAGKITVKDCIKLTEKGIINTQNLILPYFLKDLNTYKKALERIAVINFLK